MSRVLAIFGSQRQNNRLTVLPHLYFTYLFIGLLSSVVYEVFGREVLVTLFSWYYLNGINTVLLVLAVVEYVVRIMLINRKHIR
jgi:hypothetical protein